MRISKASNHTSSKYTSCTSRLDLPSEKLMSQDYLKISILRDIMFIARVYNPAKSLRTLGLSTQLLSQIPRQPTTSRLPLQCTSYLKHTAYQPVRLIHTESPDQYKPEPPKKEETLAKRTVQWREIYTIPNILTYTRIVSSPFVGYFIVAGETRTAVSLFVYSCVTDFIDGYIARRFNMKSVLGSIIDPMADKLLMTVCTVALTYTHAIPGLVASLIIGRDVMLSAMSLYYRYKTLPPPKTVKSFVNLVGNPTLSVHPNMLGKVNTALQMVYIGGLVCKPFIETQFLGNVGDLDVYFNAMAVIVSSTTVASGVSYIFSRNSFKYIK